MLRENADPPKTVWRVTFKGSENFTDYDFDYCEATASGSLDFWDEVGFWLFKKRVNGATVAAGQWVMVESVEI
jgi:hypothetical protein